MSGTGASLTEIEAQDVLRHSFANAFEGTGGMWANSSAEASSLMVTSVSRTWTGATEVAFQGFAERKPMGH